MFIVKIGFIRINRHHRGKKRIRFKRYERSMMHVEAATGSILLEMKRLSSVKHISEGLGYLIAHLQQILAHHIIQA